MAKTESTAVNELINLVQTATPLKPDPHEDLMFRSPEKKKARMTSTVPAIKADVPPLPRLRAPQGTQRGVPIVDGAPPPVRMSTAARALSVPPLIDDQIDSDVITAIEQAPVEARKTSLPAPHRPSQPPPAPRAPATKGSMPALPAPRSAARVPSIPSSKSTAGMPALPPAKPSALRTEAPPQTPVAAPFEAKPEASPIPAPPPAASPLPPMLSAYPSAEGLLQPPAAADMTSHQPWFDAEVAPAAPVVEVEVDLGTDRVHARPTDWKALLPKLIVPTLALITAGMFVGGYLAFKGQGDTKPAQPVAAKVELKATSPDPVKLDEPAKVADEPVANDPAAQPSAPEPAPITPPNLAPHAPDVPVPGRPTFVDVRIDSKPSGATVTLVDRGKSMFLGTTPISTALDPSRQYDIVFTLADKPTQIERLDPATTKRLAVVLGKSSKQAVPKTVVAAKQARPTTSKVPVETKQAPAKAEPTKAEPEPAKAEQAEAKQAVVDPFPAGEGTLMISSKPPCEIYIDGVATGLTTPQRAIKLTAGKHKVTLVNTTEKIKKTLPVTISPDQPTKVIENFMK